MHKAISFVHVFKFIFENHYNSECDNSLSLSPPGIYYRLSLNRLGRRIAAIQKSMLY